MLAPATVYEIRPLDDTAGTWIVSLLVPRGGAPGVASAAAAKALSLALVAARAMSVDRGRLAAGSPGATTLALGLGSVWERPGRSAVVVEADPDGGVVAARLGLGHHPCLTELAVRARSGARTELVWDAAQVRPGGGPSS